MTLRGSAVALSATLALLTPTTAQAGTENDRDAVARNDHYDLCYSWADDGDWLYLTVTDNDKGWRVKATDVGQSDNAKLRVRYGAVQVSLLNTNGVRTGVVVEAQNGTTDNSVLRVTVFDC